MVPADKMGGTWGVGSCGCAQGPKNPHGNGSASKSDGDRPFDASRKYVSADRWVIRGRQKQDRWDTALVVAQWLLARSLGRRALGQVIGIIGG